MPLKSASRRILLIGDSFTEGIGQPFENTFAGLLAQEGAKRANKVEFLNAGVASYSPTIYYAKIKYLLDKGLQFDEVVLLSDSSDVEDEASSYFCIDEDPKYRKYCNTPPGSVPQPAIKRDFFIDHFAVTNRVRVIVKRWLQTRLGNKRHAINDDHNRIGWTSADPDPAKYRPLGVDGGIARSLANMTKLVRPPGEPQHSAHHRGLSLGAADRAERSRQQAGQAMARFLPRTLQGFHRPVPGLLCRR